MKVVSDSPLVSVVTATYNMGQYVPLAVQSVLEQTYKNIELIIVDDGSTDDTQAVLKPYLADPRVKYIHQKNQGQTRAKNKGILESTGDYIAILDADDIWLPHKIQKQLPCFEISPDIGVVYTNVKLIDEKGDVLGIPQRSYFSGMVSGRLLVDNFVNLSSVMISRKCLNKVGIFDERYPMSIDYDLWLRISAYYEFYYVDDVTFYYRIWDGQMSHNYKKRFECAIQIMNSFLEEHPTLVDKKTVREAWAHTYVSQGNYIKRYSSNKRAAFIEYVRALTYVPTYLPSIKSIVKLLIRR
jgi:glycosyltransferase involved in cell wall biosynthesis